MGEADDLRNRLGSLLEIKPEAIARRDVLGQYHFGGAVPVLEKVQTLGRRLLECDLGATPDKLTRAARERFEGLARLLDRIRGFDSNKGSAGRDTLLGQFNGAYEEMAEASVPLLSWDVVFGGERAEENARRANEEAQRLLGEVRQARTDAQEALSALRTAATKGAIRREGSYFNERADGHARTSRLWLCATVLALAGFGLFGWWLWTHTHADDLAQVPESVRTFTIVGYLTARFVTLAVLGYALAWAARNHRAHRHNEIVNRHRALALQTFEAFEKGVEGDPQTRNAILLQAAQCAFSPQISGYMTGEPDPLPHNTVVEVLKAVGAPPQKG